MSGELESLPEPQRRALETALQLRTGSRSDHLAVGAGTLSVLRALAARNPVLLAIDDLQWLDRSSARAVAFALRRLGPEPVRLLGSVRAGTHPDATIELDDVEHVRLGPLSVGAIGHLLAERVPLVLPRTVLRNVHETAHGNPFFALELGRALAEADVLPGPGELLPVPGELHQLLSARVRELSPKTRGALLAAALLAKPTEDVMTRASADGWNDAFEEGMRAGVVELPGATWSSPIRCWHRPWRHRHRLIVDERHTLGSPSSSRTRSSAPVISRSQQLLPTKQWRRALRRRLSSPATEALPMPPLSSPS